MVKPFGDAFNQMLFKLDRITLNKFIYIFLNTILYGELEVNKQKMRKNLESSNINITIERTSKNEIEQKMIQEFLDRSFQQYEKSQFKAHFGIGESLIKKIPEQQNKKEDNKFVQKFDIMNNDIEMADNLNNKINDYNNRFKYMEGNFTRIKTESLNQNFTLNYLSSIKNSVKSILSLRSTSILKNFSLISEKYFLYPFFCPFQSFGNKP